MKFLDVPVERRFILRGAFAAAILIPLGASLTSCSTEGPATTAGGKVTAKNPFGVAANSTIDAVIFNGGYKTAYASYAATLVSKNQPGISVKVTPSTNIAQELQPRFVGGNPPDVIDNSGANLIGLNTIRSQVADLTPVINAKNLEGLVIKDTLYPGVLAPGTIDGKLLAINYVLTVFALWHSESLFAENGWTAPKTWEEAYELGGKAKAKGKYLFCWGKEAATYYLELAIASAIKEGGNPLRLSLENLKADCWSHPAMQDVLTGLAKIISAGYVKPGGSGTQFTAAQAQWSNTQDAILYPSGSWIENEMKDQTKTGFAMTGTPAPTVSSKSKMPYTALHSAAAEAYIVPSAAKNVAGGKEFLRAMLSKDAAANFAESILASTIVKGSVPADGFGSTALVSQTAMLDAAGEDVYTWSFVDLYSLNTDMLVVWNTFLDGKSDVKAVTAAMQQITDKVRNDTSVKKIEVK